MITHTLKPDFLIATRASLSIKSQTTAPFELKLIREPIIVASAIESSTRFTSSASIIFFLTFLTRPFLTKATSSLVLQKTPTLGFSSKSSIANRDFSILILFFPPFEIYIYFVELIISCCIIDFFLILNPELVVFYKFYYCSYNCLKGLYRLYKSQTVLHF